MQNNNPFSKDQDQPQQTTPLMPLQQPTELPTSSIFAFDQPKKPPINMILIIGAAVVGLIIIIGVIVWFISTNKSNGTANTSLSSSSDTVIAGSNDDNMTYTLDIKYNVTTAMTMEEYPNPDDWTKEARKVGYLLKNADSTKTMQFYRVASTASSEFRTDRPLTDYYLNAIGRVVFGQGMATDKVATMAGNSSVVTVTSDRGATVECMKAEFTFKGTDGDYHAVVVVRSGVDNTIYATYITKSAAWADADASNFISKLRIRYGAS